MTRILIVDDQPHIRKLVRGFLENENAWVVCGEAADGQQAVEQAEALKPNVILLDIQMPVKNGFDAARQILRASPGMLILILSIHQEAHYAQGAKDCGARGFLPKHHVAEHLVPAVAALLRGELHFPSIAAD